MADQRRTHRLPIELAVTFHPLDQEDIVAFATTMDISATGLSLLTKEPLAKGQKLKLQLELPRQKRITIHGEVVRVEEKKEMGFLGGLNEFKIGIKIVDPIWGDEAAYVRFVAEKMKEQFGKGKD